MPRQTGYEPLFTLKPVAPDLWVADGSWIRFYGLPFPTRMTVIRLRDGGLWVHSPIADAEGLSDAVEGLGPVAHLVAPNWIHYAWLPDWQARFPLARAWGCPGVVERARSRGVRLELDGLLGDSAPAEWAEEIDQRLFDSRLHCEVLFCHMPSRSLILTDLVENFEPQHMPWWARPILKLGGVCYPKGGMPRDIALSARRRPEAMREILRWMRGHAPERILFAHGRWIASDAITEITRIFGRWG